MSGRLPDPLPFVFFDLDGTLLDNTAAFPAVFVEVLGQHGVTATLNDLAGALNTCWPWYEAHVGLHKGDELAFWLAFNTRVSAAVGAGDQAQAIGAAITEAFTELDRPRLYPDVLACLDALAARGHRLGVITARPDARRVLDPLGLSDRFQVLVDAFSAGSAKQDATSFNFALDQAAVDARQAVHIGDQIERDVLPAQEAGLTAVLIDRTGRHPVVNFPRMETLADFVDYLVHSHMVS